MCNEPEVCPGSWCSVTSLPDDEILIGRFHSWSLTNSAGRHVFFFTVQVGADRTKIVLCLLMKRKAVLNCYVWNTSEILKIAFSMLHALRPKVCGDWNLFFWSRRFYVAFIQPTHVPGAVTLLDLSIKEPDLKTRFATHITWCHDKTCPQDQMWFGQGWFLFPFYNTSCGIFTLSHILQSSN